MLTPLNNHSEISPTKHTGDATQEVVSNEQGLGSGSMRGNDITHGQEQTDDSQGELAVWFNMCGDRSLAPVLQLPHLTAN